MPVAPAHLLLAAALGAGVAPAAEPLRYSEAPLQQPPLLTGTQIATGTARFYNEVDENLTFLTEERKSAKRLQAYLLIDSILKRQRADGRTELDDSEKKALGILLDRSTQFGVFGAGLVARQIAGPEAERTAAPLLPPDPFELRLEFPRLVVSSRSAPWRVEFPWYFMFWEARRYPARNGLQTDVLGVSTSFSSQDGHGKHAQGEIMFVYSPGSDCDVFDQFWLDRFGMTSAAKEDDPLLPSSARYTSFDSAKNFRKEILLSSRQGGCAAFAYLGFSGPFVANRVSYLDFIGSYSDAGPLDPDASVPKQVSLLPCASGQFRHVSGCVPEPVLVKKKYPQYPGAALSKGIEGQVTLQAFINSDGSISATRVEHCTHPGYDFEKMATKAVMKWQYDPATVAQWPRDIPLTVVVEFEIPRRIPRSERKGPPTHYDAETLAKKREKVLGVLANLWCRDDSQCASVALGSRPCGGPRENRVYSLASVEERRLTSMVADYNAYEAGWNEQEGLSSDCSVAAEAQPACLDHKCIDRNLAR